MLNKKIVDLLGLDKDDKYVDFTVTFTLLEGGERLKGVPPVRLRFE